MKRKTKRQKVDEPTGAGEVVGLVEEILANPGTSPALTAGDVDADWQGASTVGDEAVGGSVSTPDQDIVDDIGRALGVEQGMDDEVTGVEERVAARDRARWRLEREAADEADERGEP
jgi:hypothetical protein